LSMFRPKGEARAMLIETEGIEWVSSIRTFLIGPARGPVVVLGGVKSLIHTICKTGDHISYDSHKLRRARYPCEGSNGNLNGNFQ